MSAEWDPYPVEVKEQAYPTREQLEAGIELAEAIGPGRTTRFRQMLNMHDALDAKQAELDCTKIQSNIFYDAGFYFEHRCNDLEYDYAREVLNYRTIKDVLENRLLEQKQELAKAKDLIKRMRIMFAENVYRWSDKERKTMMEAEAILNGEQ